MSDVIKLVQYFRNLDHFPYYSRVRKLFYPDQPPVSTVVQVSEMLPDATVLIEVEATVWLPRHLTRGTAMINGYIPAARFLPFLSWTDVAALPDKSNTVIVLPTGAIEQHGPHLPCSVDSVISSGVAGHALARLPATIPAYAIPPIVYGKSEEHLHFPGTLTLSGDTLLHTLLEIAESLSGRFSQAVDDQRPRRPAADPADRLPGNAPAPRGFHRHPHDVFNVPNCEKQFSARMNSGWRCTPGIAKRR